MLTLNVNHVSKFYAVHYGGDLIIYGKFFDIFKTLISAVRAIVEDVCVFR